MLLVAAAIAFGNLFPSSVNAIPAGSHDVHIALPVQANPQYWVPERTDYWVPEFRV
ncbi:MAG: hypothetical protein QOI78_2785 [Actinomycetota bacterium]|nr:hypothetical protein [Actinomycetota bacterium]